MKKLLFTLIPGIISLTAAAQIPNYVPTNGLVGWWPFNGNANDESGNGNNGTVNGATLTTDRFGVANKAYYFSSSGCNTRIDISNFNYNGTVSEFSISFWMKRTGNGCISPRLFEFGNGNGWGVNWVNGLTTMDWVANQNLQDNTWYHVVYVLTPGTIKSYVNGIQDSQFPISNSISSWFYPSVCFGRMNHPAYDAFNGNLDDISVFNRALTQQEITNLYNSQTLPTCGVTATNNTICAGSSTTLTASSSATNVSACASSALPSNLQNGLLGYWPFCGNANDASGNGNNGTVNGATLIADRFGNANGAYSFDGVDDHITNPPLLFLNGSIINSINSWVQINSGGGIIFGHWVNNSQPTGPIGIFYGITPDNKIAICTNGGEVYETVNSLPISWTEWKMITLLYNGNEIGNMNKLILYVNGLQIPLNYFGYSVPNTLGSLANSTYFGARGVGPISPNGIGGYFTGKLDDIAIYNRALTVAEIQQLYNQGQTTYSWSNGATTPSVTVSPTQTTTYTCTVTTNGTSCSSDFTVTVNPLPTVNAGNDQTVCSGTAVTLSGTGANTYSWNNSVSNGVAFTPGSTATYTVTGTNTATGCTNTDQVIVNVNALPAVNAGNDQTVCAGTAVTLSGSGANTYSWNNGVNNGVAFTPAASGAYLVTGTDANNCSNTDQVLVTLNPLPPVIAGADQTVCTGAAVTLSGNGANTYSWNNSVSNGVAFTPGSTTTYTVTGTDTNNCSNIDQVTVTVNPLPTVSAGPDQELCQGQSVTLFGTGADTYSWSNNVTNGVGFLPTNTQTYVVSGTNSANGCENFDTVTVIVNSLPTVSAGLDQTICKGDSLSLTGSGALSYQWNNNVTDGVFFAPQITQAYSVTGTDANGCVGTDAVTVNVNDPSFSTLNESALDSYTLNGQTYTQSGTYTQVLTNAAGCDSTITLNLELSFTGMNTLSNTNIVIAPNPANDYVQVTVPEKLIGQTFILMDNSGRAILEGTFMQKEHKIDLKHLAVGVYVLKIHDGTEQTFRILKN
jgi:hypothetical protein